MNKKKVSVIVPVYNVEQYLEKCLKSITEQTYDNLEIIVVNDGSPDHSEKIIKEFQKNDDRITYIKKENGGLSSARNAGLEIATGDYISFIDSDDWIRSEFISTLVTALETDGSDIAICTMNYIYSDGTEKKRTPVIKSQKIVDPFTGLNDLFEGSQFKCHAQNKLYKRELFYDPDIRYPIGKIFEDVFTTYKLFFKANKISYIDKTLYYYLQNRPGSILQSQFDRKRLVIFEALDQINAFLKGNKIKNKYFHHFVIENIISLTNSIYPVFYKLPKIERKNYIRIVKEATIRYDLHTYWKEQNISSVEKLRYYLLKNHITLYVFLMKIVKKQYFSKDMM